MTDLADNDLYKHRLDPERFRQSGFRLLNSSTNMVLMLQDN